MFLQRTTYLSGVDQLTSYRENLACLDDDSRYLIVQPSWFRIDAASPQIRAAVKERYDCANAIDAEVVIACPRR
ncbi:hypothetical protein SAMN05421810_10347 [Amycolatopsis arida]|uniref:Uncharacterized protein n=1 Tax=Amycolatopsis arida TaxID=587909 RepID=A0A1I5S8K8_9PSEU|nr:hypothetical protein [Amycolatopsis arida]TDX85320.1 hypothetical protein CLV69_11647 [Amycolatopsis arida]SFP67031.1 hypothetical protein SAMN05421810_10347 [Amycolatopsis arida]